MKQYVCSICGYVFDEAKGGRWEDLPENWKCPGLRSGQGRLSGEETAAPPVNRPVQAADTERELSAMELSIICSNLARGCEKQYMRRNRRTLPGWPHFSARLHSRRKIPISTDTRAD